MKKLNIFLFLSLFLLATTPYIVKAIDLDNHYPLIDITKSPSGLKVPKSFLGLHLNRWSDDLKFGLGDLPMPGEVAVKNGSAYFRTKVGYGFYYYTKNSKVKLTGMNFGGKDFLTTIESFETPSGVTPAVAKLANIPPKIGNTIIRSPTYVPTFGYSAIRSHDSGVSWASLNKADGVFNEELMTAWIQRHKDNKIMFTMTGTPEWLAASNIVPTSRKVSNKVVTIKHLALPFALPVGAKVKIRGCQNGSINGERIISSSTLTTTTFEAPVPDEGMVVDNSTELLLWSNAQSYGYMNPPKDFTKVNVFVTWLMKNYGAHIDWIEGPNEANVGHSWDGKVLYNQITGLWWVGTYDQLGEMMRRINVAAKAINPAVLIGSPSISGFHTGQPINQSPSNRAASFQMLSAGDGVGGKLMDWVDFVPFHIYGYGQSPSQKFTDQITGDEYKRLYENLHYLKTMLAQPEINKPNIPIYMNEGGFGESGPTRAHFEAMSEKQQSNEIFRIAAIYAGFGVKGFYPYKSGFFGDFETQRHVVEAYQKINQKIAGKTISPDAWIDRKTGGMLFKTTDGYEEYIP